MSESVWFDHSRATTGIGSNNTKVDTLAMPIPYEELTIR